MQREIMNTRRKTICQNKPECCEVSRPLSENIADRTIDQVEKFNRRLNSGDRWWWNPTETKICKDHVPGVKETK